MSLYVPDGQYAHVLDPVYAAYLPTGHAVHVVAPSASLYVPGGQCTHVLDTASAAYLPAGHSTANAVRKRPSNTIIARKPFMIAYNK